MNTRANKLVIETPREVERDAKEVPSRESTPPSWNSELNYFSSDDSVFDENYKPPTEPISEESHNSEASDVDVGPSTSNSAAVLSTSSADPRPIGPFKKWSRVNREERKQLLNSGKSFVNSKGRVRKSRELQPLGECRMKCHLRLEDDDRKTIFKDYWGLGNRNKQVTFVANLVQVDQPKTTRRRKSSSSKERNSTCQYYLPIRGTRIHVCKKCFAKTLDIKDTFIKNALRNKIQSLSGIVTDDQRGKITSKNKKSQEDIDQVVNHINSIPSYESHYTRRTNDKKYLPSSLNLSILYRLYKEKIANPVSRTIYEREFHKLNLKFKKPFVDTCSKCDTLHMRIKVAEQMKNEDDKKEAKNLLALHQEKADFAYASKNADKAISKMDSTKESFSFDLQQCLPTPQLASSVAFYKRQLWTFNLTIHNNASGFSKNYMWHEAIAGRGANEIASCLYKCIQNLESNITEITFYSDTCQGQNKNSHVCAMFLMVMSQTKNLNIINHKFLEAGHTHMECDVDHSQIEKQKKKAKNPIYHPHDWYQLVRSIGTKFEVFEMTQEDIFNFANLLSNKLVYRKKNDIGEQFKIQEVSWFQYRKAEVGKIYYKNNLEKDTEFKKINFLRKKKQCNMKVGKRYSSPVAISVEKKKDLLELLSLIPPLFHPFYENLITCENSSEEDPDLRDFEED